MITLAKPGLPQPGLPQQRSPKPDIGTKSVLNCYEILNAREFSWPVNIYRVQFVDPSKQTHGEPGRNEECYLELAA